MRRHLGYTPDEARALPWWQTALFAEGLNEEFSEDGEGEAPTVTVGDGGLAELGALGITARQA